MKKLLTVLLTALFVLALTACGSSEDNAGNGNEGNGNGNEEETTTITVGATAVPHAEVLEEVKPLLAEQGIELKIETYQDYVLPNQDLDNGTLDANYFQHIPYLEQQKSDFGYDFVNLGGIHIEPIGIYSVNHTSVDAIPDGTAVLMSNSVADHGRILSLLEVAGLIKLKDGIDKVNATEEDIVENPKNLDFDASYDAGFLPQYYEREEDTLVAINTNYAIEADLIPAEDALILEGSESPYVNVIAARSEDENNEALKALVEALRSEDIQNFINEKYEGAVVPVNE
ncbi:MetQ/NlpA family ABC transporter substrate-binding protein [Salirhabdus salicampi]|uniref:MetQ/NlpA family ABC transporter substrate-binding protein n=1 Tax=Salirhabdus salicampi TaxID=476102 RepID=UPI0020C2D5DB|nr:MetQ/NlpA family ABC transporter substrate-binding protein [Salirhabdus salicampi]MCP8617733.1 MetQ/NlpA family ABC transporter substrate-binding protein [Salirhabdus salicampi]